MGWMYGWHDRASLVEHLTKPWEHDKEAHKETRCIRRFFAGNDLWTVWERDHVDRPQERYIVLFMLRSSGFGGSREWGYKDVEESCGPCQLSCPVAFLDLVPEPDGEWGKAWRARIRERAACRQVGARVKLYKNTRGIDVATVKSLRPFVLVTDAGEELRGRPALIEGPAEGAA